MTDPQPDETIGQALARIPSGCCIITCSSGSRSTGMLASWVQQAAFDPPAVTVAVGKTRPIRSLLDESRRFVLNLIGENPRTLMKHFGRGFGPDDDAFAGLDSDDGAYGPRLGDAIATLACTISGRIETGDHVVYVGHVQEATLNNDQRPYVHSRKSGFSY